MNQCRKPPFLAPITDPSLNYLLSHANVSGKKIKRNVYGHLVSACFIVIHLIFTLGGYVVKNLACRTHLSALVVLKNSSLATPVPSTACNSHSRIELCLLLKKPGTVLTVYIFWIIKNNNNKNPILCPL